MESAFDGLAGVMEEAMKEIMAKFKEASKHAGIWESLQAFAAAVDWQVDLNQQSKFNFSSKCPCLLLLTSTHFDHAYSNRLASVRAG